jgi:hypothetical protein
MYQQFGHGTHSTLLYWSMVDDKILAEPGKQKLELPQMVENGW